MNCEKCLGFMRRKYFKPVNLCPSCLKYSIAYKCQPNNFYVYKLYDRAGRIVYVGMTNNPLTRFKDHVQVQAYWRMDVIKSFEDMVSAAEYEAYLIFYHRPKFNTVCVFEGKKYYIHKLNTKNTDRVCIIEKIRLRLKRSEQQTQTRHTGKYCKPITSPVFYALSAFPNK